jgi:hypothetical protein
MWAAAAPAFAQPPERAAYDRAVGLARQGNLRDALTEFRGALRANPRMTEAANDMAWIMATAQDKTVRNPQEAVTIAEQMVDGVIKGFINRRQMTGGVSPPKEKTYAGLPRPPSFYKVTIISTLAAAYAAAGRMAPASANACGGTDALSYGTLALQAAQSEHRKKNTPATQKLVATAQKYLNSYKSRQPLVLARPLDQQVIEAQVQLPGAGSDVHAAAP